MYTVRLSTHSEVDETQRLLQCFLFRVLVVVVGLLIKLCNILHHLQTETKDKETAEFNANSTGKQ